MEEIEVPTEHLHETIKEKLEEAGEEVKNNWFMFVAISTALIAVFAAVAGLLAGHHSNEALIEQIKASDKWAYFQAKGIKADIKSLQPASAENTVSIERYKKEQEEIQNQAKEHEELSEAHLAKHIKLARSVTLFQIAIAIAAIAILTRKKILWLGSLALAGLALVFFITGFI